MYYRYKSRQRSTRKYKVISMLLVLSVLGYGVYHFKDSMQFWKYSMNKVEESIVLAESTVESQRQILLSKSLEKCDDYIHENPFQSDGYYLKGRVLVRIAISKMGITMGSFIEKGDISQKNFSNTPELIDAIKFIEKGIAFDEKSTPKDSVLMSLSMACFLSGYRPVEYCTSLVKSVRDPALIKNDEDRRYYGLMMIISGEGEKGIRYLSIRDDSGDGALFVAYANMLAKQFSSAIMKFKEVLNTHPASDIEIRARMGLGKSYFAQSLFSDAELQFTSILLLDPENLDAKIFSAKTLFETGDKAAAKKICDDIISKIPDYTPALEILSMLE